MTWTATKQSVTRTPGDLLRVRVTVAYANEKDSAIVYHDVTSDVQLQATVTARLAQYEQADALLALLAADPTGVITPTPPPIDPNAGLATLTVAGLLSELTEPSRARLVSAAGAFDALRRDVENQDRPAITNWIALFAAQPAPGTDGVITQAEASALLKALAATAPS